MAHATIHIVTSPTSTSADAFSRLGEQVTSNERAVRDALALIAQLSEKGLLEAATALLAQSQSILRILLERAKEPNGVRSLQNLLTLVAGFAAIDNRALADGLRIASAVSAGYRDTEPVAVENVWDLARLLKDEDVKQGLGTVLSLLKAVGQAARGQGAQADGDHDHD